MRCHNHISISRTVALIGLLYALFSTTCSASASNRNAKMVTKYESKPVTHTMQNRGRRSALGSQDFILSNKMDANIMQKLGNMKMRQASADRSRRHENHAEAPAHVHVKSEAEESHGEKSKAEPNRSVGLAAAHSQESQTFDQNDNRPKPAGHLNPGKGHASVSEFELPSPAFEKNTVSAETYSDKNLENHHHQTNSDSETETGIGTGDIADVDSPIKQLIDQSTDLAKETRVVFQVIAAREDYLVTQMESFKKALRNAIEIIQDMAKENKLRYKRWDRAGGDPGPYKACVYVEPSQRIEQTQFDGRNSYAPPEKIVQEPQDVEYPPLPITQETKINRVNDDIDLTSIYWLKLPQNEDSSSVDPKIRRVLNEVRQRGRDVILVPVLKGFTSAEDLAKGFLRAVRVNPADFQSSSIRIRRV